MHKPVQKTFVAMMNSTNDRIAIVSFSGVDGSGANKNNVDTTIGYRSLPIM